jgi:hypothetical protein
MGNKQAIYKVKVGGSVLVKGLQVGPLVGKHPATTQA